LAVAAAIAVLESSPEDGSINDDVKYAYFSIETLLLIEQTPQRSAKLNHMNADFAHDGGDLFV
jgi:hypothetical protein